MTWPGWQGNSRWMQARASLAKPLCTSDPLLDSWRRVYDKPRLECPHGEAAGPEARHRQQELLLLVDAPLGTRAPGGDRLRRSAAQVRERIHAPHRRRALFADAQSPGAAGGRRAGVGLACDLRDARRALSRQAALAGGGRRAPRRALDLRRDAFRHAGAAQRDADEHPCKLSGQGPQREVGEGYRARDRDLELVPRPLRRRRGIPVRALRRRRRLLCAGRDALSYLCRVPAAACAGLRRRRARRRRGPGVDGSRAPRDRVRGGRRALRLAVKAYVVGGAVRDELLGLPLKDRDYVVVGATPEEMERQGYKPVGKDFPVFLHPTTHEEYALARTERKSGRGYKGFTVHAAPDVSLEDDLRRRDLTINAIAKAADGTLADPFHGRKDLEEGVLRHVSDAFVEDPVPILRVARFAARFGFGVHEKTMQLMRDMVASGEADSLVPERV